MDRSRVDRRKLPGPKLTRAMKAVVRSQVLKVLTTDSDFVAERIMALSGAKRIFVADNATKMFNAAFLEVLRDSNWQETGTLNKSGKYLLKKLAHVCFECSEVLHEVLVESKGKKNV